MTVSPEERDAMARLLSIMDGSPMPSIEKTAMLNEGTGRPVELAGPGSVTQADVNAMASVLHRLNDLSNHVVDGMISEGQALPKVAEALNTQRTEDGVKVGRYQIMIKEDQARIAGKQYYSIYNSLTNDIIADEISLYETALSVVRLLNSGKFANSSEVRKLFEQDDLYTSHKVDAILFKRKMNKSSDRSKRDIFESRYQASLDRCMAAKKNIKILSK